MENKTVAKKTAKDSVFRDLFEDPKYLLELYQALHPEDEEVTEDQINSVTIQNVLLDQMYNDLGFTVGSKLLVLVEAQSTWSVNIAVRALLYLVNTWKEHIESQKLNVYGSKKVTLPKPELYVIYTGDKKKCPEWLKLSEEFFPGQDSFVDAKVKVLTGTNKGDIIDQYVAFTKVYNQQIKALGRTRDAVMETIRICKDQNVLKEYLQKREKEVVSIMTMLFDQEYAVECYGDEKREEGKIEGEMKKAKEMALSLAQMGISIEKIAEAAKVSTEVVQEWLNEGMIVTK